MSLMALLSHFRAFPEVLLLAGSCALMIVDLYVKDERRRISFYMAQAILLLCFLCTTFVISESEGTRQYIFYGLFVSDLFSSLLKLAAYVATSVALVYSRQYLLDRGLLRGEFITLLLFALLGMMIQMSANSFLTVYLGLEPVTLFIGSAPKLAAFAMAIRLLVNGLFDLAQDWQQMLALLALLSMAIGNITAIAQTNLKRMLAYSTIAHMGFMLLGLLSGFVRGNALGAADAYGSALFYVTVYTLMALGSFGMLLFLSRAGFDCETLDDMRGLAKRSPWYAFVMMVVMFSLAGAPPTAGFYAKLAVLSAAVSAGQLWLAVAAVVLSLVGAFSYLRVVKLMYFDEPRDSSRDSPAGSAPVEGPREMRVLLSANGLILLFLGILPQTLMGWCLDAVQSLRVL